MICLSVVCRLVVLDSVRGPGLLEARQGPQLGMQLLHRQVSKDEELVTASHKSSYKEWEPTWVCPCLHCKYSYDMVLSPCSAVTGSHPWG